MPDSDVNPVNRVPDDGANFPQSPDPTTNSIGNQLWLATYFLYGSASGSNQADQMTFSMAMQAIQAFMTQFPPPPAGTAPTDPYLHEIWNDLQTTDADHPQSLATLAADYSKNGFNQPDLNAYNSFLKDDGPHSIYSAFATDINQWGSKEGSYQSNPSKSFIKFEFLRIILGANKFFDDS